jgi:DNA primase
MNNSIVAKFVEEDFGIKGYGRWLKGIEHDSLVVDTENDLFFWNKNKIHGDALSYLIRVRGLPLEQAKTILNNTKNKSTIYTSDNNTEYTTYNKLVDVFWNNGKTNRKYWHKRLLTDSTIDRFKLGYYDGWYTIPIFENGMLVNIQKRRDEPEKAIIPWYKGKPTIFNSTILKLVDEVFFTEGIVDCILLNQNGLPSISKNTGAITWLNEWLKFFVRVGRIYLIFDNDDAGRSGAKKIAKNLGEYKCKIFTFEAQKEKYDIIDYFKDGNNIDDFIKLVEDKSKYVFEV